MSYLQSYIKGSKIVFELASHPRNKKKAVINIDPLTTMAPSSQLEFNVVRKQPELLPPAEPTPFEWKELSDIDDQDGLRLHISGFFIYPPSTMSNVGRDNVALDIRRGLSKAMVFYYPLAGRIREGPNRKLSVECTGEGIMYCEADADVRLEQFGDIGALSMPFPFMDKVMFETADDGILGTPLMYFQSTRFICGGIVVAGCYNHAIADALGFYMFMAAAAQLARGAASPTPLPVWQRERLLSRVPPRVTFIHHEYIHDTPKTETANPLDNEPWPLHSIFFTRVDVAALRAQLPGHLRKSATSFEIISACLWRCRTAALRFAPDELSRLIIAVNARTKFGPPLPQGYYGNSIMLPMVVSEAGKLVLSGLGYAVELVIEAKGRVTEEYVKSVADYLVLNGRPHYVVTNTYLVSDLRRLIEMSKFDWGWGKPAYVGPADVGENAISFLATLKNGEEEGVVVPIRLPESAVGRFKSEVSKMVSFGCLEDVKPNRDGYLSRM